MSSFITKEVLNGDQLTDETSLALKIIKNQYCFWNGLEEYFAVFGKSYCILIIGEYKLEKTSVAYEI